MAHRDNGQNMQDSRILNNRSFLLDGYIIGEEKIKNSYLKWILITTVGLFVPIGQVYRSINDFYNFELDSFSKQTRFISLLLHIIFMLVQAVIIFRLDWDYFWSYIDSLELLNIPGHDKLMKKIKRKRVINVSTFASILLIYNIRGFINTLLYYDVLGAMFHTCHYIGYFFLFIIVVDMCVCLQTAFESVNQQIVSCCSNNNQILQLQHLLHYRQCWFYALEATQSAEKFLRHFITFFYVRFAVNSVFNQIQLFHYLKLFHFSSTFYYSTITIIHSTIIWYITAHVIAVNTFSQHSLEELYELTFKTDSIILEQQIYMFLDQVSNTDAGFTFGNLFLITPNFITSFITLTLTITIACLSYT